MYLSGSYARGDWLLDSDMDLVIVSKAFHGLDVSSRFALVKRLMLPGLSLDLLAYTPSEFEDVRARSMTLQDMLSYGVKVS